MVLLVSWQAGRQVYSKVANVNIKYATSTFAGTNIWNPFTHFVCATCSHIHKYEYYDAFIHMIFFGCQNTLPQLSPHPSTN